jgi:hypothetical protein
MVDVQLEWAFFTSTEAFDCPHIWQRLDHYIENFELEDQIPCWGILGFSLLLPGETTEERLRCRIERNASEGVWLFNIWSYEVPDEQGIFVQSVAEDMAYDAVAVRQIPAPAIFNCALSIVSDARVLAVFTNLAGTEVQRVQPLLPAVLTMRTITNLMAHAALGFGLLRSQNQDVAVLLNGSATPLDDDAVLWRRDPPRRRRCPVAPRAAANVPA